MVAGALKVVSRILSKVAIELRHLDAKIWIVAILDWAVLRDY